MRRLIRRVVLAAVVVATAVPDSASAVPRPDLVVTAARLTLLPGGANFVTRTQVRGFSWGHTTRNVGRATASRSRTGVEFVTADTTTGWDPLLVPRLRPGRRSASGGRFRVNFANNFEYGTYRTRACADMFDAVAEGDEGNNCRRIGTLYVVPNNLDGRITGRFPMSPGVLLSWSGNLSFDLQDVAEADQGIFGYDFFQGPLPFIISGTDSVGCTWDGGETYQPSAEKIRLNFAQDRYRAAFALPATFHFPAHRTCNGNTATIDFFPASQGITKWLDTNGFREFPDPGLTNVRGRFIDNVTVPGRPITYTWNLEASG